MVFNSTLQGAMLLPPRPPPHSPSRNGGTRTTGGEGGVTTTPRASQTNVVTSHNYTPLPTRSGRIPQVPDPEKPAEDRAMMLFNDYFDWPSSDDEENDPDFNPAIAELDSDFGLNGANGFDGLWGHGQQAVPSTSIQGSTTNGTQMTRGFWDDIVIKTNNGERAEDDEDEDEDFNDDDDEDEEEEEEEEEDEDMDGSSVVTDDLNMSRQPSSSGLGPDENLSQSQRPPRTRSRLNSSISNDIVVGGIPSTSNLAQSPRRGAPSKNLDTSKSSNFPRDINGIKKNAATIPRTLRSVNDRVSATPRRTTRSRDASFSNADMAPRTTSTPYLPQVNAKKRSRVVSNSAVDPSLTDVTASNRFLSNVSSTHGSSNQQRLQHHHDPLSTHDDSFDRLFSVHFDRSEGYPSRKEGSTEQNQNLPVTGLVNVDTEENGFSPSHDKADLSGKGKRGRKPIFTREEIAARRKERNQRLAAESRLRAKQKLEEDQTRLNDLEVENVFLKERVHLLEKQLELARERSNMDRPWGVENLSASQDTSYIAGNRRRFGDNATAVLRDHSDRNELDWQDETEEEYEESEEEEEEDEGDDEGEEGEEGEEDEGYGEEDNQDENEGKEADEEEEEGEEVLPSAFASVVPRTSRSSSTLQTRMDKIEKRGRSSPSAAVSTPPAGAAIAGTNNFASPKLTSEDLTRLLLWAASSNLPS